MPYKSKTIKEIPKWLDCPICGVYQTLHYNYLMNHFKKCEEYENHIDDVEMYDLDNNTTVGDYIQQKINVINTTKKLIQTNELENIQDQLQDVYDDHQEIQEMMSINLGEQFEMNDDELDAELESLGQMDMSDTSCLDLDYNTPSVPSKEPSKRPITYGSVEVDEFGLPNMILN